MFPGDAIGDSDIELGLLVAVADIKLANRLVGIVAGRSLCSSTSMLACSSYQLAFTGAKSTKTVGAAIEADEVVVVVVPVAEHARMLVQVCVQVEVMVLLRETVVGKQKSVQWGTKLAEQEDFGVDVLFAFDGSSSSGVFPGTFPGGGGNLASGGYILKLNHLGTLPLITGKTRLQ